MLMMFDEMILPICDQEHLIVQETVVSLSLLVHDTLCPLLSDGLSLSTHTVQFQFYMFCCNVGISNFHSTGNFDRH